jgi:hemerythrin-like domain-containing protein
MLDAIFGDVDGYAQEREFELAAGYFALFRQRLETHIDAEETLLFPLFELQAGWHGPPAVMRREHADIRWMLRALSEALAGGAATVDPMSLIRGLARLLESHNAKEERMLYPAIDRSATTAGVLDELVGRLEAFLERRERSRDGQRGAR